jgi:hypothetical protein
MLREADFDKSQDEMESLVLDSNRDKEILAKAITGILILLLKFFRVSRNPSTYRMLT